jgi:hypothetical protein
LEQPLSDHEWYVPLVELLVPVAFLASISYFLWSGKIPVAGRMVERRRDAGTFWLIIIFFLLCAGAILNELLFPNWSTNLLHTIGIIR